MSELPIRLTTTVTGADRRTGRTPMVPTLTQDLVLYRAQMRRRENARAGETDTDWSDAAGSPGLVRSLLVRRSQDLARGVFRFSVARTSAFCKGIAAAYRVFWDEVTRNDGEDTKSL